MSDQPHEPLPARFALALRSLPPDAGPELVRAEGLALLAWAESAGCAIDADPHRLVDPDGEVFCALRVADEAPAENGVRHLLVRRDQGGTFQLSSNEGGRSVLLSLAD